MTDAELRAGWNRLDRDAQIEVLGTALGQAILDEVSEEDLKGLGQETQNVISAAAMRYIEPLLPALGEKIKAMSEPVAKKAGEVVEEKLIQYGPYLAIFTGLVAGVLVVAGIWFARRYI